MLYTDDLGAKLSQQSKNANGGSHRKADLRCFSRQAEAISLAMNPNGIELADLVRMNRSGYQIGCGSIPDFTLRALQPMMYQQIMLQSASKIGGCIQACIANLPGAMRHGVA